jgi:hypothetical protein
MIRQPWVPAASALLALLAFSTHSTRVEAQDRTLYEAKYGSLPPNATHCNPWLPIHIELLPLNEPRVGQDTRFQVLVDSVLDPDLVKDSWIEYRIPPRVRRITPALERGTALIRAGTTRKELSIIVPDAHPYEIRARLVVQLSNGQTISQTAVRWVNIGNEDASEGYLGRIVDQNGTGIRVYEGSTVRR